MEDFAYWDNNRVNPGGLTEEESEKQRQHLREIFVQQQQTAVPSQRIFPVEQPQQAIALPGQGLTLCISTSDIRLDIKISPIGGGR